MEKWMRGLSKTTALIIGIGSLVMVLLIAVFIGTNLSGLIPIIILGAILGGGIGFSVPLVIKGFTGYTPQEKKELSQKKD